MNQHAQSDVVQGETLDNSVTLTIDELCGQCGVSRDRIIRLVEEGIVDPTGSTPGQWRFAAVSVTRVRFVERLARDLEVNTPGAALALDLVDELERLRARLRRLEALS